MDASEKKAIGLNTTSWPALCVVLGCLLILIYAAWSMWGRSLFTLNYYRAASVSDSRSGLHAEDELVRLAAARGLGRKGRSASNAIPDLIVLLDTDSPRVASAAAWALGHILSSEARYTDSQRSEAMTSLTSALGNQDVEVRRYAAYAMSLNPSIARRAIPQLTALLEDPNAAYVAARALGEIGPEAIHTTPNLVALLDSSNPGHRAEAAVALSKLQPLPKDVVTAIMELLEDDVDFVRSSAARALDNISWATVKP